MRKRRDRDVPIVAATRLNKVSNSKDSLKKKCGFQGYGLPNYLPESSPSEDATSVERHKALLAKQFSKPKAHQNTRIIDASMEATFNDRRLIIVQKGYSLVEIRQQYACLFDCHQVSLFCHTNILKYRIVILYIYK